MKQPNIFISYSHIDEIEKSELVSHLRVLKTAGIIQQWVDDDIRGGDKWKEEIDKAIQSADLAILLISKNFLNSEFIRTEELPTLRERARTKGMVLFPIIARHCHWTSLNWLGEINVRPKNGTPVWPGNNNVDETLTLLVQEIEAILEQKNDFTENEPNKKNGFSGYQIQFNVNITKPPLCFFDVSNQVWIYDRSELAIFGLTQFDALHRRLLPDLRLKHVLKQPWNHSLVCSDWNGAVYQFDCDSSKPPIELRIPKHNDLPCHMLKTNVDGELLAACWDGSILKWSPKGQVASWPVSVKLSCLPKHFLYLQDNTLIVAGQDNVLHQFDPDGNEIWNWCAPSMIHHFFCFQDSDRVEYLALQLGNHDLIKLVPGHSEPDQKITMPDNITNMDSQHHEKTGFLSVMSLEGNAIEWVSWSPFKRLENYRTTLDFKARQLALIHDEQRPNTFNCIGLSQKGLLFSLTDKRVTTHDLPACDQFLVGSRNRFLIMISEFGVQLIENPSVKSALCQIKVKDVLGTLAQGVYKKIQLVIENCGTIPVLNIRATLSNPD
ncbi:MAG: toll/interleukin-1 receptor domain-containing protein, partial [Clostridiales bacterium]|nr:toll/interleukin-1 receptor domain-containing protein [Clostridiales bacterium]